MKNNNNNNSIVIKVRVHSHAMAKIPDSLQDTGRKQLQYYLEKGATPYIRASGA